MAYDINDLEKDVDEQKEKLNRRLRERYKLAKDLGFNSAECTTLKLKSEETIRRLAKEKGMG